MRKILYFLLVLFVISYNFGINVSVYIDNYGWIKISSEKNISAKINNLNYLDIYKFEENGTYKFNLKVPLDKEHKQLIYNLSPIGNFKVNKVESSNFLKIDSYKVKNGIIDVKYSYNYFSISLLILGIFSMIVGVVYYTKYLNKLFKNKATSIKEKSKVMKKYTRSMFIYSLYIAGIFLITLIYCDAPIFFAYILNISLELSMLIYIFILLFFVILPPVLSAKNMVKFFSTKNKEDFEKEIKKSPLIVALSLLLMFAPMILIFLMILYNIPDIIIKPFKNEFYKLPVVLRVAFWITFYYFVAEAFFKIINSVLRLLKISNYVEDKDKLNKIKTMVNEISEKLNVKPFKKIEIIKSSVANAFVEGLFKEKLIITSKLLEILSDDELKAIIAHELAHKKRMHIKIGFIGFIIIGAVIYSIAIYLLKVINFEGPVIFMSIFLISYFLDYLICRYISRRIEKDADLLATKVVEPKIYIKALSKIHFASYIPKEGVLNIFMTHPSLKDRIKYIQKEFNIPENEIKIIMDEAYKELEECQKIN
ncbi:M48 family metalloprotease [Methanocaldococcus indicus]|uniref:M48 family metalloprotease n=1 Tax=Methanocaldococcus indicus TaxID=213231 RepID=UPI003C6D511F